MLTTITISAITTLAILAIKWLFTGNSEQEETSRYSKMWQRIQKSESKVENMKGDVRHALEMTHDHDHVFEDVYRAHHHFQTLLGIESFHFNKKDSQTLITYLNGNKVLVNWSDMKNHIPLTELKGKNKDVVEFFGTNFSYKKPVSTDF